MAWLLVVWGNLLVPLLFSWAFRLKPKSNMKIVGSMSVLIIALPTFV